MDARLHVARCQQDAKQRSADSRMALVARKAFQIATLRDFYFRGIEMLLVGVADVKDAPCIPLYFDRLP
jgi:hypothetical protein